MKVFVILAVVAAASANPQVLLNNNLWGVHGLQHAVTYNAHTPVVATHQIVAPLATKTQYHAQDELGQASYGFNTPGHSQAAVRDAAGNVRGSYAYINPNGKEVRVEYTAGHGGFQVASNDLPVAPSHGPAPVVANLVAPAPVQDTPEVIQARAAHAVAHQQALARAGRKKRQILTSAVLPTTALGYSNVLTHNNVVLGHTAWNNAAWNSAALTTPLVSNIHTPTTWNGQHLVTGYSTPVVSNVVAAPAVREATRTVIQNTPGHAVSYRVD